MNIIITYTFKIEIMYKCHIQCMAALIIDHQMEIPLPEQPVLKQLPNEGLYQ
ncbi:hypothetical protein DDB_G0268804 [Dictyostelium discoideum AX4]|uniref:Uncharacterized protein n=1 Tax=Dictyostelium discoideum TaxID=44689 RepID=Q55EP0_DICDI|nr:hypothetical protein DDB_G0268804 [Dictyostelium discoideum AX4]EAL72991.1 hypothetical protein DDB_G0268804 [Dictyostelium discoideum AX4]|eukprot:XP_646980.1 hypothetical protein DDB_G0268804 [Dictyostelium discoideum AX4]